MSEIACLNPTTSFIELQFPTRERIQEWRGKLYNLFGAENDRRDGKGFKSNFILSNHARSDGRVAECGFTTDFIHLMPEWVPTKIRSVDIFIHPELFICGFQFFDKDKTLIWEIGATD